MRRLAKAKVSAVRASLRKVAAALTARRVFPAWIDAEQGIAFPATVVTPRVRDSLVLRLVTPKKSFPLRNPSYAHGGR